MVDWSLVSQIITAISAVLVAFFAFVGLRSWRTQLAGTSQFKLASKVVRGSLEFRDDYENALNSILAADIALREIKEEGSPLRKLDPEQFSKQRAEALKGLSRTVGRLMRAARESEVLLNVSMAQLVQPVFELHSELAQFLRLYDQQKDILGEYAIDDTRKTMGLMKLGDPFDRERPRQVAERTKKQMAKYLHDSFWRQLFGG